MHQKVGPRAVRAGEPIRVVVIDEQTMIAGVLAASLHRQPGIEVLRTISRGDHIETALAELDGHVDVAVVDLHPAGDDPAEVLGTVRAVRPGAKRVVLTSHRDDRTVGRALEAGCDAYLLKDQSLEDLHDAVRRVMHGEAVFAPAIMRRVVLLLGPARLREQTLTSRELDVMQGLVNGRSTAEIAASLSVSVNTARNHVQSILDKFGVHSRREAVSHAVRIGLVSMH